MLSLLVGNSQELTSRSKADSWNRVIEDITFEDHKERRVFLVAPLPRLSLFMGDILGNRSSLSSAAPTMATVVWIFQQCAHIAGHPTSAPLPRLNISHPCCSHLSKSATSFILQYHTTSSLHLVINASTLFV